MARAGVTPRVPDSQVAGAGLRLADFFTAQGAVVAARAAAHTEAGKTRRPLTLAAARRVAVRPAAEGLRAYGPVKVSVSEVFDTEHWNRVLAVDVLAVALAASTTAGRLVAAGLTGDADAYDADRTRAWLTVHADAVAAAINTVTASAVDEALHAGHDAAKLRDLFGMFASARAPLIARTEVTAAAGFGTREAGMQTGRRLVKTWRAGPRPRSSHARLDGETVDLHDRFGNGARWPGDSILPTRERARCDCSMTVTEA